jgi:hypothetical protein
MVQGSSLNRQSQIHTKTGQVQTGFFRTLSIFCNLLKFDVLMPSIDRLREISRLVQRPLVDDVIANTRPG